jgi:hypothetical protein
VGDLEVVEALASKLSLEVCVINYVASIDVQIC